MDPDAVQIFLWCAQVNSKKSGPCAKQIGIHKNKPHKRKVIGATESEKKPDCNPHFSCRLV